MRSSKLNLETDRMFILNLPMKAGYDCVTVFFHENFSLNRMYKRILPFNCIKIASCVYLWKNQHVPYQLFQFYFDLFLFAPSANRK